jgi:hypothetical protein
MIFNQTRCLYERISHIHIKQIRFRVFSLVLDDDDDTSRLESHVSSLIRTD